MQLDLTAKSYRLSDTLVSGFYIGHTTPSVDLRSSYDGVIDNLETPKSNYLKRKNPRKCIDKRLLFNVYMSMKTGRECRHG